MALRAVLLSYAPRNGCNKKTKYAAMTASPPTMQGHFQRARDHRFVADSGKT
jgi:hypothetical protein